MKYVFILIITFSVQANCLKDPESLIKGETNSEIMKIETFRHKVLIPKDSCGSKGCEITIFSENIFGCFEESLNQIGYYFEKKSSLELGVVFIKSKGKVHRLTFNSAKGVFE